MNLLQPPQALRPLRRLPSARSCRVLLFQSKSKGDKPCPQPQFPARPPVPPRLKPAPKPCLPPLSSSETMFFTKRTQRTQTKQTASVTSFHPKRSPFSPQKPPFSPFYPPFYPLFEPTNQPFRPPRNHPSDRLERSVFAADSRQSAGTTLTPEPATFGSNQCGSLN